MRHTFIVLLFIIFSSGMIFGQLYQGPADGVKASGVTVSTGTVLDSPVGVDEELLDRLIRTNIPFEYLPDSPDMPEPTGPEGSNYVEDPNFYSQMEASANDFVMTNDFEGIPDQGWYIPPDPDIAVGPSEIIAVVNSRFRIINKTTGAVMKTIEANSWFSSALPGCGPFDPKVIYDHYAKRWVQVWLHVGTSSAYFLISVSDDSTAMGTWYNWAIRSDYNGGTSAGNWADYEGVGFDQDAVYLTSNQFSYTGYFNYGKIRILNKSDLYANNAGQLRWKDLWDIRQISGNARTFGLRPTIHYTNDGTVYFLSRSVYVTGTFFSLYKLTDPTGTPSLTAVEVPVTAYSDGNDAQQLGGSGLINAGASNLRQEAVYQDGILHAVHSVRSGAGGQYSSVRYFAIDVNTNTAVIDQAMGIDPYFHYYPALAIDENGNVAITYTRSSSGEYASAYYTTKPVSNTTMTGSQLIKPGNGYYYKTFGGSRNRWGDYMGAYGDPTDRSKIYTLTEYVRFTNNWGTWIAELTYVPDSTDYVTVTAPDGGEFWNVGDTENITWVSSGPSLLNIEYSTDNGSTWINVANSVSASTGSYSWTIPNTPSTNCLVAVYDASNSATRDESNSVFTIGAGSQFDWELMTSGVTSNLTCVDIASPTAAWIGGEGGVVLKSTDGGMTWSQVTNVPGNRDLYDIACSDENTAIVGAGDGTIYRTTDGGSSWAQASNQSGSFINVVDFKNSTEAFAQGDPTGGVWRLLKSTDGGANWTLASSLNAPSGEAGWNGSYDRIGNKVWFGTNNTKVYVSDNGMDGPWTSYATTGFVNSYGLAFGNTNNGVITVNDGSSSAAVLRTTDGGATWQNTSFPATGFSNNADFVDGTSWVWVGTFAEGVYHSTDNGATWILDDLPTGIVGVNSLKMHPDANNGIAVGEGGIILKSNFSPVITDPLTLLTPNGGEEWNIGSTKTISWSSTLLENTTITNVALDYSTDNGSTWTSIESSLPASNSSYNWTVPNTPSTQCLVRVSDAANSSTFDESDAVFTIKMDVLDLISPNGGEEWRVRSEQTITWSAALVEGITISNVALDYSTDNGATWQEIEASLPVSPASYTWEVPTTPSDQCLVRVSDVSDPANYDESDAVFTILPSTLELTAPNGGEIWVIGNTGTITWNSEAVTTVQIYLSTDGGSSWGSPIGMTNAASGSYDWTISNTPSENCLIRIQDLAIPTVGDTSDAEFTISVSSGVNDFLSGIPTEFALHQNFPNPFNPTTTIYYSVPERSNVRIVVYDLLGKAVAELVNETKSAGNYKIEFNGAQLNSGIYFYRMEAGSFTESRKLMLLK